MTRKRKRRRSRRRRLSTLCALLIGLAGVWVVLAAGGGGGVASTAFSTATAPRGATADVTIDSSGAHSLDTAQSVHTNSTEALVNVTNRLARDASVTVALRDDSTGTGDLVVDGSKQGDIATFTLSRGGAQTVEIEIPDDSSLVGETVYFHVNATATGLDVRAPDRSAPIEG
ncbi:MAG: hypothetical protein ABEH78_10985 [Haloferacaceae archaeon]